MPRWEYALADFQLTSKPAPEHGRTSFWKGEIIWPDGAISPVPEDRGIVGVLNDLGAGGWELVAHDVSVQRREYVLKKEMDATVSNDSV